MLAQYTLQTVSICLTQVGVLLKRLNVGLHKQRCTWTLVFLCQISPRNSTGIIQWWRRMQVVQAKVSKYPQTVRYISKTVQDRCIVSTGWAKKTGLFFRLDNFVTVSPRKACSMSKFSLFYREKGTKLAFQ